MDKKEILEADIHWHPHAYATCPYCGEVQEVDQTDDDPFEVDCTFCWGTYKYTTEQ